jgi:hypothetical protein
MSWPFGVIGSPTAESIHAMTRCDVEARSAPPVTAEDMKMRQPGMAAPEGTTDQTVSAARATPFVAVFVVSATEVETMTPPAVVTCETKRCAALKV